MVRNIEICRALADQMRGLLAPVIEGIQIEAPLVRFPTPDPAAVDVYPNEEFQESVAFGNGNVERFFTVRARVNTPDSDGAQDVLLDLMEPEGPTSVEQAILSDRTLGDLVGFVAIASHASGYGVYSDPGGQGQWLGCVWRIRVLT